MQSSQTNETDNMKDADMKAELLKQLHEQYAVNNNANLGTIVTLVVAVIAVIGYFGYVYVHTGVDFSDDFGCLVKCCGEFYLDALFCPITSCKVLCFFCFANLCESSLLANPWRNYMAILYLDNTSPVVFNSCPDTIAPFQSIFTASKIKFLLPVVFPNSY